MPDKACRYPTVAALAAAYKAVEIKNHDGSVPKLVLDNDCYFLYVDARGTEDDWTEVFRGDEPPDCGLLSEALTLLGIPHEGV